MGRPTAGTILRMKKAQPKPKKKTPSLKNKIRNLERFLKKDTLPADVRQAKEEELKELQRQTEGKQDEDKSREITLKFKKVRFFDRRRLMRSLKKLKRQLDEATSTEADSTDIQTQFQQAKENMMYVYYYPKGERYINLFPEANKPHSAQDVERQEKLKKAALKAFNKDDDHTAFDHYCFNDEETAPVEDKKDETKKRKIGKDGKTPKRKDKRRKTSGGTTKVVVADNDGAGEGANGDDDFFL